MDVSVNPEFEAAIAAIPTTATSLQILQFLGGVCLMFYSPEEAAGILAVASDLVMGFAESQKTEGEQHGTAQ